jgi:tetratricopeptide (TPR) repeat protein
MAGRRLALVTLAGLIAAAASRGAIAQPREPAAPDESEPGQTGSAASAPAAPVAAPVKDPKLAKKWLAAAQQLMQKGSYFAARNRPDDARPQFEDAVAAYQRAIDASGDPNVYLDLANAEDRLGKLDEAVKHLRRVTAEGSGARPEVIKKATARLQELLARVGVVTLVVTPPGASITLGGAEVGTSPLAGPLVLMPGTYTLAFQAVGFRPKEAEITVEPGREVERAIALDPVTAIAPPIAPVAPGPAPDEGPRASKLPLYVGAGIAAAAALDATIFGVLAIAEHATFTGRATSGPDREVARTRGRRFALVADASFAAAAVAAGFTAYWYFYRYKPHASGDRSARPAQAKLDVVPWVQPRSGGAAIAGWF